MTAPSVQIGSFKFFADSALGVTFGVNTASAYANAAYGPNFADAQLFVDLVALGASRVRFNIVREVVETAQGTFTWAGMDNLVYQANKVGLRVTLIARGFQTTNCPPWAADPSGPCAGPGGTHTFTSVPAYIEYATALAQRYSGDGNHKNAKAPDGSGLTLQVDNIEVGNEEFNTPAGTSTDCRDALRYVWYVRQILPAMRAPTTATQTTTGVPLPNGGGNWVPRDNFLARVGQWGVVHSVQSETQDIFNKLCFPSGSVAVADPNYPTWNPSHNPHSVFGFDPTLGYQLLDYSNFHNYTDIWNPGGAPDYDQGTQCHDIRTILNSVTLTDNTRVPIWCTETGENGLVNGPQSQTTSSAPLVPSEQFQSTFYAQNNDGTGPGVLKALYTNGCQHLDVFTINYAAQTTGTYTGQLKAIACRDTASRIGCDGSTNTGYTRFQAFCTIQNFFTTNGATWTALAVPNGFGGGSTPPPSNARTRDIGTRFKLISPARHTGDIAGRFNLSVPHPPAHDITTRFNLVAPSPPSPTPAGGLGVPYLGAPRLGDLLYAKNRALTSALLVTYTVAVSQRASALPVTYTIQAANVGILMVYYLISGTSAFSINGDATIIAPDQVTYTPRSVVGRTLLAGPLLQGYKILTWTYSVLQRSEFNHLISFYNPQHPTVTLTYPDEQGVWVQRTAQMLPPQYGTQSDVSVTNVSLTFTGLLT